MGAKKTNRTKYLLEPQFQKSLLRYTCIIMIVTTLIYYFAIQFVFSTFIDKGASLGLPNDHIFFTFVRDQESSMNWTFLVTAVFSAFVIFGYGLYFSHRVAGPIYKLRLHLKSLRTGKTVEPIQFRNADFFKDLAEEINEYSSAKRKKA